jgi:multicomponent Na+:H+ antiporter subunit B
MEHFIIIFLLSLLAITAIAIIFMRNMLSVIMLGSIYSLLSAVIFVVLDAVDVAFTEAAVGAGISSVLFLSAFAVTGKRQVLKQKNKLIALIAVSLTAAALLYATSDMPHVGDPEAPVQTHVAPRYIEQSGTEVGIPNIVTSVLASYRGFDTLGEVTVVFTAMIAVLLLLLRREDEQEIDREK